MPQLPAIMQKVPKPVLIGGGLGGLGVLGLGIWALMKMTPITRAQVLTTMGGVGVTAGATYAVTRSAKKTLIGAATGAGLVTAYYELFVSGVAFQGSALREGDSGWAVRVLQSRLTLHGFPPDDPPGTFGKSTTDALKRFQQARGVVSSGVADSATWGWLTKNAKSSPGRYSPSRLIRAMERLGYQVFTDGRWNLVGVRSMLPTTNRFDDEMYILRKKGGSWEIHAYPITTDPGVYYLLAGGLSGKGVPAVAPGQFPNSHKWGYHRGEYEALVQSGPMKIYRDANMNALFEYDPRTITTGTYGINIHKASANATTVDKFSAGCQVFARSADFEDFLSYLKQSGQPTFSYTLLTGAQV